MSGQNDIHGSQPILTAGPPLEKAAGAIVLLHGRGGSAEDILSLFAELGRDDIAAVAPQAPGHTWYPHSFLAPLPQNQPWLDSALNRVESIVDDLMKRGVQSERIGLLGFSQGACLTAEFTARHPRRYGAIMCLTGGLIGPPGTARAYPGSLDGTPIVLAAGDPDPHVPFERVEETSSVFARMKAQVDLRRYPGLPHSINQDELSACRELLRKMTENDRKSAQ